MECRPGCFNTPTNFLVKDDYRDIQA
jgi:hypothetical protein